MDRLDHDIAQDLLPLYHDGVCSERSRAAVEEHLQTCGVCRAALAAMDAPLPEAEKTAAEDAAAVKKISSEWKKGKRRAWWKGALIAAAVCAVLMGGWLAATQLYCIPVDPEKIEITNVRQLSDGRILYHFYIDDDLNLREIRYEYSEDGSLYCLPLRVLMTERRWEGNSPANMDRVLDMEMVNAEAESRGIGEITHVWYGQGEDAVLLWEEGMELPAAGEQEEAAYGYSETSAAYWADQEAAS